MADADCDAVIVGAGAVGLACAHALALRGLEVVVLERERRIGSGVSSRNSEVIHAGLYYPTGSLKARMCVEGRRALYDFLQTHAVNFDNCGKLVVATNDEEVATLERIAAQAEINDVEDVHWRTGAEACAMEPNLFAVAALESKTSGVLDAHGFMDALRGEVEAREGAIALNTPFLGAAPNADGVTIRAGGADPTENKVRALVIAAGLGAQSCAHTIDGFPAEKIPAQHLAKGNYFALEGVRAPFARLIYPPPIPGALGTHYRRDLGGAARFGPDLQWIETEEYSVDPARADKFYADIRRYWPGLPDGALVPDYAGIRPKIHGPGEPQPDFMIQDESAHGLSGLIALFGIESPGLTSSLALGEEVAGRLAGV
jgi:L-2-hydroxyglutarate oxidase LhgO